MIRKIFAQSLLYFVASYTPMLANLFLLPIINQYLSPEDYAIFGLTFGYIGLLQGFSDLGMMQHFQDTFFKEPATYKVQWSKFLGFLRLYRLLYALVLALLLFFLFRTHIDPSEIGWYLVLVIIPVAFFDFTKGIAMRHCQFRQDHRRVYAGTLMSGLITVVLTYVLIVHGGLTYMAWFVSAFAAKLAEYVYYGYYLHVTAGIRASRGWTWKEMGSLVRQALPLVPKKYANYLVSTSDRAVLDFYRARTQFPTMGDIGLYNVAYNFANYFGNFQGAVTTVMSPILYKLFADKSREAPDLVRRITLLWFLFSLVAAFLVCLWTRELVQFLFPKAAFHHAYTLAPLLIMGWCHRPLNVALFDAAIFHGKNTLTMKVVLLAGVSNVLMNLVAVPLWGVEGAMFTSFLTYLILGFVGFYMPRIRSLSHGNHRPEILLALMLLMSCAAYVAVGLPVAWRLGITALFSLGAAGWFFTRGKKVIASVNRIRLAKEQA